MKKHLSFLTSFILGASLLFAGYEQTAVAEADADGSQLAEDTSSDAPVVFFTSDISAEGMMAVYEALGWKPDGKVAVKLSTGEPLPAIIWIRSSSKMWWKLWMVRS